MLESSADALLARSIALRSAGRYDDALEVARTAVAADPNDFDALGELATVLHLVDRETDALDAIERCCAMEPNNEWAHRLRSAVLRHLGRNREAVEAARIAVDIDPNDPISHSHLAYALIGADQAKQALAPSAEAVRLGPEMGLTHETQGYVFLMNGKYDLAEGSLRKALELEPERTVAKYNLGLVLRHLHRADEAIPLARSLILENPGDISNVHAMVQAGHDHVRRGPINRAMFWFLRIAFLRFPLVMVALLLPFALLERQLRRRSLPPGTWEAIKTAKKTPQLKAAIRESQRVDYRLLGFIGLGIGLLLLVSLFI